MPPEGTLLDAAVAAECELSDRDFKRLSSLVYDHCGINLHDGKLSLVRARIAKRLRSGNFASVGDYLDAVERDGSGSAEFTALIDAISTNLTSFFREVEHFRFLESRLLPTILAKRGNGPARIRAWSAGCSTGEEPYSLAITLLDAVGAGPHDVKLLATDICTRVLKTAQIGVYDESRVAPVSPQRRAKYFDPARLPDGKPVLRVGPAAREVVRFRHLNLMQPWPFTGPFDFIFCRNVMIYFDKPTQERLVQRYFDCLAPGGMLFTGHSESLTGIAHRFKYVAPTIYAKP